MKGDINTRGAARAVYFEPGAGEAVSIEKRPHVIHEGRRICIRTHEFYRSQAIMLPLRNGFPIHSSDRVSPIYCLHSDAGVRVGHAIKLDGFGLRVFFEAAAPPGDYFFLTSTVGGTA